MKVTCYYAERDGRFRYFRKPRWRGFWIAGGFLLFLAPGRKRPGALFYRGGATGGVCRPTGLRCMLRI